MVGTSPLRNVNCEWWGVGPSGCADIFPQGIAEAMMQGFYAFERATFIADDAESDSSDAEAQLNRVQFWNEALAERPPGPTHTRRHQPQPLELRPLDTRESKNKFPSFACLSGDWCPKIFKIRLFVSFSR